MSWVYFLGEVTGADIKIGATNDARIASRRQGVDREQMNEHRYVLLAGVRGDKTSEKLLHLHFASLAKPKGSRREYFAAGDELVEYILWLREQWFVVHDETATEDDAPEEHRSVWEPASGRRTVRPVPDPFRLFQAYEQLDGPLAGTAWSWMPGLRASFNDYFTPPDLVRRAETAMGGIDLDAASHWLANRKFRLAGIKIIDYFHINKDAMTHDWNGRVWLNPPYGENERWFRRAAEMLDSGQMTQLCMLSPVYAFTTKVAASMTARAAAAVLLSPTPEFENPSDPLKTGTNLPHAIFYWGDRVAEFTRSFDGTGIPFQLAPVPEGLFV